MATHGHRVADDPFVKRSDLPLLFGALVQILLTLFVAIAGSILLHLPASRAILLLGVCYGAFRVSVAIRARIMRLAPTEEERRISAKEIIMQRSTANMTWRRPPTEAAPPLQETPHATQEQPPQADSDPAPDTDRFAALEARVVLCGSDNDLLCGSGVDAIPALGAEPHSEPDPEPSTSSPIVPTHVGLPGPVRPVPSYLILATAMRGRARAEEVLRRTRAAAAASVRGVGPIRVPLRRPRAGSDDQGVRAGARGGHDGVRPGSR